MKILVAVLICNFLIYCYGQNNCSGIDISNERRFSPQKLSGKWDQHYYFDNTDYIDIIPKDAKVFILPVGNTLLVYFSGRPVGGTGCLTTIFLDKPKTNRSPCYDVRLISPNLVEPLEFIFVLFPGDDVLFFAHCVNPPSCTSRKAGALTRRPTLCRGERKMFNQKLKQFGFPLKFKKPQAPTSNNCTFPGVPGFNQDKEKLVCKKRNTYGK